MLCSFCLFYILYFFIFFFFFFFQAEDGIRDDLVTGVQTCALPISTASVRAAQKPTRSATSRSLVLRQASIVYLQDVRHRPEAVPSSRTHNSSHFPNVPTRLYNS